MWCAYLEVIAIIVIAGMLGGTVNYALARTENSTWVDWLWSVVIGVGASVLVPLFLNTISSTLLSDLLTQPHPNATAFVFAGFCVLGAIASKTMIQSLTEKLFKETEAVRKKIETLQEEVAPIVEKETESEVPVSEALEIVSTSPEIAQDVRAILSALNSSKFTLRSVTGVAKEIGKPSPVVRSDLEELRRLGFAAEVQGKKGPRWSITPEGRRFLEHN